jgi:hypothetical protein
MIYDHNDASKIVERLFEPEMRRLAKKQDAIIAMNNEVLGKTAGGFTFKGSCFMQKGHPGTSVDDRPPLHGGLWAEAEKLLADETKVSRDMAKIRQALCLVFTYCPFRQMVIDTLPDVLWKYLVVGDHVRQFPVGYGLNTKPIVHKQFLETMELVNFYAATELLY